jgi:hypothetical protein
MRHVPGKRVPPQRTWRGPVAGDGVLEGV